MGDVVGLVAGIAVWAVPVILAVTLHEVAHGYAALAMGDDTARRLGRLSLNPLRHVDPFGTVILPALMLAVGGVVFGWAKPVPVDFRRLRPWRLGMVVVAAAGPLTNLALAAVSIIVLGLLPELPEPLDGWAVRALGASVTLNLLLAVFNLIPLPPLDGGRVVTGLLPAPWCWRFAGLERVGMLVILGALVILPMIGQATGLDLDLFGSLVTGPVQALGRWMVGILLPGA